MCVISFIHHKFPYVSLIFHGKSSLNIHLFSTQHEQWRLQPIKSNTISPSVGSIKLPTEKLGPMKCKVIISLLQKETNENDKVDDQDLA